MQIYKYCELSPHECAVLKLLVKNGERMTYEQINDTLLWSNNLSTTVTINSSALDLFIQRFFDKTDKKRYVELKDISLPEEMKRVIARVAEAEREKLAVITKAHGEVEASENLKKAAENLSMAPGALHLRTLETLNDLSSDQSNTVIFALPIEVLKAVEGFGKKHD